MGRTTKTLTATVHIRAVHRRSLVRELQWFASVVLLGAVIAPCAMFGCSQSPETDSAVNESSVSEASMQNADLDGEDGDEDGVPMPPDGMSIAEASRHMTLGDLPGSVLVDAGKAEELIEAGAQVVDVRNRYDYAAAHIDGARNMAAGKSLEVQSEKLSRDVPVLVVGGSEGREAESWQVLVYCGFSEEEVYVLEGGMESWKAAGLPTVTTPVKGC